MQRSFAQALVLTSLLTQGSVFAGAASVDSPGPDPKAAVRAAITNYATAVYEAKPLLIDESVHTELAKLGLVRREGRSHDYPMSFAALRELCVEGYDSTPARRDIEVLGVMDRIACAKIIADWGTDYFHLGRDEAGGPWKIRHVLWQSHPGLRGDALAAEDRAAIESAAYDYIDAFYLSEPERVDRSVAADLVKFGYYAPQGAAEPVPMPMNHAQLKELAATVYRGGSAPKDAPREVEILDALDHIALVKVVGSWGVDYMQIAKRDRAWKILHVIWQSHPAKPSGSAPGAEAGGAPVNDGEGGDDSSGDDASATEGSDAVAAGQPDAVLQVAAAVNKACPFSGGAIQADSSTV